MMKVLRFRGPTPKRGVGYKTTTIQPTDTRLSDQSRSTALVLVKAKEVPEFYTKKTFDKQDPATAQLLIENGARVVQDTMDFKGQVLTRVTGTLRRRKRQHRIEQAALRHILKRHSPRHFAGKFKLKENWFPKDITIAQIIALMVLVYRNGRRMQRRPAEPGHVVDKPFFRMTGRVNGVAYVLGLNGPKVVQFYPRKDSVAVPGPTRELLARLKAGRTPVPAAEPEKE
jgi:hypothetical protein